VLCNLHIVSVVCYRYISSMSDAVCNFLLLLKQCDTDWLIQSIQIYMLNCFKVYGMLMYIQKIFCYTCLDLKCNAVSGVPKLFIWGL